MSEEGGVLGRPIKEALDTRLEVRAEGSVEIASNTLRPSKKWRQDDLDDV